MEREERRPADMVVRRCPEYYVGHGREELHRVGMRRVVLLLVVTLALTKTTICAEAALKPVRQCVRKDEWSTTEAISRSIRMWDYTLFDFQRLLLSTPWVRS